jgi:glycosyltransferase involved in cell wall biosynthesis
MNKGILHLIHSGGFYGAEAVVLNLCLGLRDAGIKTVIGCFLDPGVTESALGTMAEAKGIPVRYIHFKTNFDMEPLKNIREIVVAENIGLIHSHGYKPSFYCLANRMMRKVPYMITDHLQSFETWQLRLYYLIDKISMLFAEHIVAVSSPIAKKLAAWKMLRAKVTVINNGIDVRKYQQADAQNDKTELRCALGLKKDSRLIGTIGRLCLQKSQDTFIAAASIAAQKNPNLEFMIVGEGERRTHLEEQITALNLGDKIHLTGFRKDVLDILKLMDVFVLTSLDEGLPIVVLEAMSLGVPIISTPVGEIPHILQDKDSGVLVEPGNARGFAEAIQLLVDDQKLCSILAQNAKARVENEYSLVSMTNAYISLYDGIVLRGVPASE